MLQFIGLHKSYRSSSTKRGGADEEKEKRVVALDDVTLKVEAGSITGVVGASGAGKSTLLRMANLLERPDAGKVFFHQRDLMSVSSAELQAVRRKMGMIFQQFHLLSSKTVFENVALPLRLAKMTKLEVEERVAELLELVGLSEKKEAYPSELSGGQKQRVAIARALAPSPDLLLCDEATSALDPETTLAILELLTEINRRLGVTIFFITHEIEVVKHLATHVVLMEQGAIVEQAEVVEFFRHPRSLLAKKFIETAFWLKVPEEHQARLSPLPTGRGDCLLKLGFTGKTIDKPFITEVARRFQVDLSILSADIDHLGGARFGFLLAELLGDQEASAAAIHFLEEHHVEVQLLGSLLPV